MALNLTTVVSLDFLFLDPDNYRFRDSEFYEPGMSLTDARIQKRISDIISGNIQGVKTNPNISDLLASFKANGFVPVDKIQVQEVSQGVYKVLEGNRRVASLKILKDLFNQGLNVGKMSTFDFSKIPVEVYADNDPVHFRILMGLKHISGNKKWEAINQAELINDLIEYGEDEYDICDKLGITKTSLNRYVRTMKLIDEYKRDYRNQFVPRKFVIFEEVIKSPDIKRFIGWDDNSKKSINTINRDRLFNWFSTVDIDLGISDDELDDETGSVSNPDHKREPIIKTQDEVRELKKYINDDNIINKMEELGNLRAAASLFKNTSDAIDFTTALASASMSIDAAFRTLPLSLREFRNDFMKLSQKFDLIKSKFGIVAGGFPKSGIIREVNNNFHFLNELIINNYRGIKKTTISKLRRINLFAGGNNSGKSSILETIYLIGKGNDIYGLTDIVSIRKKGDVHFKLNELNDYFDSLLPITLSSITNTASNNLDISLKQKTKVEFNDIKGGALSDIEYKLSNKRYIYEMFERVIDFNHLQFHLFPISYVSSQTILNSVNMRNLWTEVVKLEKKHTVIDLIKKTFIPSIEDINLTGDNEDFQFYITTNDDDNSTRLIDYGDGLQRGFCIALESLNITNGILLIDEIENGIHFGNLSNLAKFINLVSHESNCQFFITSHSAEAMGAFLEIDNLDDLSCHTLYIKNGEESISIDSQSGMEFKSSFEAGIEPRR